MSLDIHPEYEEKKPSLIGPALIWLGVIVASIAIAVLLTGCASEPQIIAKFQGLCALKVIGQDEQGNIVAQTYCEAR